MVGMIRITPRSGVNEESRVYNFLGNSSPLGHWKHYSLEDEIKIVGKDVSPGHCDITNSNSPEHAASRENCSKFCRNYASDSSDSGADNNCKGYTLFQGICWLKSCSDFLTDGYKGAESGVIKEWVGGKGLDMIDLEVTPTKTVVKLWEPSTGITLGLTFLSPMFPDKSEEAYKYLSRGISYIQMEILSNPYQETIDLYLDATAQWAVNDCDHEEVTWYRGESESAMKNDFSYWKLGSSAQNVLGVRGDGVMLNWGWLYLAAASSGDEVESSGGRSSISRREFLEHGRLPKDKSEDSGKAICSDGLPALSLVYKNIRMGDKHTALIGYDDIKSVRYYAEGDFPPYWTHHYSSYADALQQAIKEIPMIEQFSNDFDARFDSEMTRIGSKKYSQLAALAYRQTFSAIKMVYNEKRKSQPVWTFVKEISTNGDMQTMDVIFPSAPMFLLFNTDILKKALIPVLSFANNETAREHPDDPNSRIVWPQYTYSDPYSPHEIGTYPVADHGTKEQEQMPMENTGNMFLMLAGIIKYDDTGKNVDFFYPRYWPLLKSWANYLNSTLPFPENQLCTDDFTGMLANNTNLAAKGIVALEAFASICDAVNEFEVSSKGETSEFERNNLINANDCDAYRSSARHYAKNWKTYAWEKDHFKIAYDFPNSYSIKYNMVWQKLLGFGDNQPFDWTNIVPAETNYYKQHQNQYGTPMDSRHNYVKLDWLSWGAVMGESVQPGAFQKMFVEPAWAMANNYNDTYKMKVPDTPFSNVPLTDLYDTSSGRPAWTPNAFVDRPVVGGIFAQALVSGNRDAILKYDSNTDSRKESKIDASNPIEEVVESEIVV